jgi:predicted deacylase
MFAWNDYAATEFLKTAPANLRHAELVRLLEKLQAINPGVMNLQKVGESYEGRPIFSVTMGTGKSRVLAWSQMHGNEPTHTAALLDLINLLQSQPESRTSQAILAGCTLTLVPMLNPDGAERYTRRNAQDIDVNRDALHLASPEGRILRRLVEKIRPQFALNLHNQQARTSVDGRKVAAVSLLVPPIDEADTQTAWTQRAKQVAAVFLKAIRPHCEGMISRYDADYMPRCFGEWIQQQEISTLTVEAGGWSTIDTGPLVQGHTVGLVNAIAAMAYGSYAGFDVADYDQLPRSSEHYLFDVIVRKVEILSGCGPAFRADLGINFSRQLDRVPVEGGGKIEDLGDLCVTSGKQEIDGEDLVCLPGGIVYAPEVTPLRLPTAEEARRFLSTGVTTVVGQLKGDENNELPQSDKLPINVGFVDPVTVSTARLPTLENIPKPLSERSLRSHQSAELLAMKDCGVIKLGAAADLVFYSGERVQKVMLGGQFVFEDGQLTVSDGGQFLRAGARQ